MQHDKPMEQGVTKTSLK